MFVARTLLSAGFAFPNVTVTLPGALKVNPRRTTVSAPHSTYLQLLESAHAGSARATGMVGLRGLLNRPGVLAADPRPGRVLAPVARVALCCADPAMDGHVGGRARDHLALQECLSLFEPMGVAA